MECPSCHEEVDPTQTMCARCGATVPPDPLIGKVIGGKYKVVQLLGEGGMGAVYKGEQTLGTKTRIVAIKTLHPQFSTDPKVQARFQREVGTIAELEHPNTIQVYDFGTTDGGQLYIVMEFIKGRNLADVLEAEGSLEPSRVEHILGQIAGSLEEAHSRGIVHRDLKPDNVVLTERAGQKEFVKVLDFGIAKRSDEDTKGEAKLTQAGMVLGTPPYMSPEQFTGKTIDARSDIYSLGVMAYEMLTGRLPFKAESAFEWATQHMTMPPTPMEEASPSGVRAPPHMRQAIKKAMAKNSADRFATVHDFFEAFSGKGVPDMPLSALAPPGVGMGAGGGAKGTAVMSGPPLASSTGTERQTLAGDVALGAEIMQQPMGPGGGTMLLGGQPGGPNPYSPATTPSAGNMGPPPPAMGGYGPPPQMGYGPPPVQAYVPAGPQRGAQPGSGGGGGGMRIALLLVAIVVGLGSVAAIVIGLRSGSGSGGGGLQLGGQSGGSQTTSTAGTTAPTDTSGSTTSTGGLEPLGGGTAGTATTKPTGNPTTNPTHTPPTPVTTNTPPPPPPTTNTPPPPPPPTTNTPPPPPPPPPPPADPPVCGQARALHAAGRPEAARLAAACRAQGGNPGF